MVTFYLHCHSGYHLNGYITCYHDLFTCQPQVIAHLGHSGTAVWEAMLLRPFGSRTIFFLWIISSERIDENGVKNSMSMNIFMTLDSPWCHWAPKEPGLLLIIHQCIYSLLCLARHPSTHPSIYPSIHTIYMAFPLSLKYSAEVPEKVCVLVYVSGCGYSGGVLACLPFYPPVSTLFLCQLLMQPWLSLSNTFPGSVPALLPSADSLIDAGSPGSLGFPLLILEGLAI